MAAAAEQSVQQSIEEAKADVREVKEQLKGAKGDEKVALQQRLAALEQRLAALEQQKLLLMQQQSGVRLVWAHSQGTGLLGANLPLREQMCSTDSRVVMLHVCRWCSWACRGPQGATAAGPVGDLEGAAAAEPPAAAD
jgi:septal ring factor EnvC (AmiA/AmiB activator)